MVELNEIYKCNVCGNIVEVRHASFGELVCCGQPMNQQFEKNHDQGLEKHVPVVEKTNNGIFVKVGSVQHPMEEKHYIEFIEVIVEDEIHIKYFKPGDKPEHEFRVRADKFIVREYCNIHGLWRN
jgi:superoxide reductase